MANPRAISTAVQNEWKIFPEYFQYALGVLWSSADNDINHLRVALRHSRTLLKCLDHKDFIFFLRIFIVMSDLYFQQLLNYGICSSSDRTYRPALIPGLLIQQWRHVDTDVCVRIQICVYTCGIKLKLIT